MLKQGIKYSIAILLVLFVLSQSVYFKKLSDVKAAATKVFNAGSYARNYLKAQLIPAAKAAPQADQLIPMLKNSPGKAFKTYAHGLDIGNIRFFMVQGDGVVTSVDENDVYVLTKDKQSLKIAIEYVFGNALRDAPGIIDIKDFANTMDLNNIAAAVDKIIRDEVLPPFRSQVKKGDNISFAGAFELNQEHINLANIEVIPVVLKINK
jgi:predicted lipoprotein